MKDPYAVIILTATEGMTLNAKATKLWGDIATVGVDSLTYSTNILERLAEYKGTKWESSLEPFRALADTWVEVSCLLRDALEAIVESTNRGEAALEGFLLDKPTSS